MNNDTMCHVVLSPSWTNGFLEGTNDDDQLFHFMDLLDRALKKRYELSPHGMSNVDILVFKSERRRGDGVLAGIARGMLLALPRFLVPRPLIFEQQALN